MRRWRERYEEFGYDGLLDRRRGQPSPKRVAVAMVVLVLELYREKYSDLNVRHFHAKLREQHGIQLSYTWVKKALQAAGLVRRYATRLLANGNAQRFGNVTLSSLEKLALLATLPVAD